MRRPRRSCASTAGMAASSLCSCSGCSFTFAPIAASSLAVWRVSSHRIRSAASSVSRARGVRSPRLPIGVETSTRPSGRAECPSCRCSGDAAHASSGIRAPSRHTSTRGVRRRNWLWPAWLSARCRCRCGAVSPVRRAARRDSASRSCCRFRVRAPTSARRCCTRRSLRSTGRARRRWTSRTPAARRQAPPLPRSRRSPRARG